MRLLSLFSGIGAFEKALSNLGWPYETAGWCEIDPKAATAYAAVHGADPARNLRDVRTVDPAAVGPVDLITYGFPCQDISNAGRQAGLTHEDGTTTRSGLFFGALRLIRALRPRYAIAENVKALLNRKMAPAWQAVQDGLRDAGYVQYHAVLNARDYGLPQQRERVLIVSIRQDCDLGFFRFSEGVPLTLRLRDVLEPDEAVPERYYLSNPRAEAFLADLRARIQQGESALPPEIPAIAAMRGRGPADPSRRTPGGTFAQRLEPNAEGVCNTLTTVGKDNLVLTRPAPGAITVGRLDSHQTGGVYSPEGCAPCPKATDYKNPPKIIKIGNLYHRKNGLSDNLLGRVYDPSGVSPALCPFGHDGPIITSGKSAGDIFDPSGVCPTLTCSLTAKDPLKIMLDSLRIRRLTPRECWRLMGFSDADFDRAEATGIGRTALYRAAGNSIAVPVLEAVFRGLREHITAGEILSDEGAPSH